MIELHNVSKRFSSTLAVDDVSLEIKPGKIYGLLGRNAAGKTTLIKIISNHIFPNSGQVLINNQKLTKASKLKDLVHVMSDADNYMTYKSVEKTFKNISELNNNFSIDQAIDIAKKFKLNVNEPYTKLSLGNKTIFKLCIALAMDVPYVFYDEPVNGLDANNRKLFYQLLLDSYIKQGNTSVISSHLVNDLEPVIEEVILIDKGKIVLNESLENLKSLYDKTLSEIFIEKVGGNLND